MKNLLFALLCFIVLIAQTTCIELHSSSTVVGNMLAEPYLAILASLLILIATLI